MTQDRPPRHDRLSIAALLAITAGSVAMKLVYMPVATASSADRTVRTWQAWQWLDDPELITHGIWGPLHKYLVALALALGADTISAPVLVNICFEAMTPWLLFFFTRREFKSDRAAILVAASYALYPIAIYNTVGGMVQPIFTFFIALAMLLLSVAWREGGRWTHALAAGLALTLAGMLRYEAWLLTPILGLLLWRKPRMAVTFVVAALLFPIFWMIGNGVHHGDPFYSVTAGVRWERDLMGRARAPLVERLGVIPGFLRRGVQWMTLPAAAVSLIGAAIVLLRRDRAAAWLLPASAVLGLLLLALTRATLTPKIEYTSTIGAMLLPFSAAFYRWLGVDTVSPLRVGACVAIVASMLAFSYPAVVPHVLPLSVHPIPAFAGQDEVKAMAPALRAELRDGEGLITDFYEWVPTHYMALLSRHHPDDVFRAPGATFEKLDVAELEAFIASHPAGVLLLHGRSRFRQQIGPVEGDAIRIGDVTVGIRKVDAMPWPELREPEMRSTDGAGEASVTLYRYVVRDR